VHGWVGDQPNNPSNIKLDVEDMTDVIVLNLSDELASVEVPDLDGLVVACADESATNWVERESTNEQVVTGESSNAFPAGSGPDFDLAVVRARDDQVILEIGLRSSKGWEERKEDLELYAS
jgi:hypothetical protein